MLVGKQFLKHPYSSCYIVLINKLKLNPNLFLSPDHIRYTFFFSFLTDSVVSKAGIDSCKIWDKYVIKIFQLLSKLFVTNNLDYLFYSFENKSFLLSQWLLILCSNINQQKEEKPGTKYSISSLVHYSYLP